MSKKRENLNDPSPQEGKRASILAAAGRMFTEQGYSGVSMDAIAEAAPVSKPTLYNHFKDKEDLFRAVMEARCDLLSEAFDRGIAKGHNTEETLTIMASNFLDLVLAPQAIALHRVIVAESGKFPELGELFYETGPKRVIARLSAYMKSLNDSGSLAIPDADRAASLFLNMIKSEHHMCCLLRLGKEPTQAERRRLIDYAVGVFMKGHKVA